MSYILASYLYKHLQYLPYVRHRKRCTNTIVYDIIYHYIPNNSTTLFLLGPPFNLQRATSRDYIVI